MALVRTIITDACVELGVLAPGVTLPPAIGATGLSRIQGMIDAWGANRLTLSQQLRTTFTMPLNTSTIAVGTGLAVNIVTPVWVNAVNYIIPGTSPELEAPVGLLDDDSYAALSIKSLSSSLPLQAYYQVDIATGLGSLFVWPKVSQNVSMVLYTPQAVGIPASLDTDLVGPPGYRNAFMYELAQRLMTPLGVKAEDVPMLDVLAGRAWTTMTRPNISPGTLSIDAALVPNAGAGYNILTDTTNASR